MSKYFSFSNEASRQEFWAVMIILHVAAFAIGLVLGALSVTGPTGEALSVIGLIGIAIVSIWVFVATCVRRCRNAGFNPWWAAATILPYVGYVAALVIGVWTPASKAETAEA